jgi:16S rRNA processing protein RimM
VSAAAPTLAAETGWPEDAVEVGIVVDAWGLKGWIKVKPFASDPQALFSSRRWFLKASEKTGVARPVTVVKSLPPLLRITQVKEHGEVVVALAQEVPDRDAAEALRGARVFIGRSSFPTAGTDEYYWIDLIGLKVVNRQGEQLGTVAGLIDTGPHSVLRVAPVGVVDEAGERLIPFVASYIDDVSLEQGLISVDWGLDF